MNAKHPELPAEAGREVIERYQFHILSLELELRQLSRSGRISKRQYESRVTRLEGLRQTLAALESAVLAGSTSNLADTGEEAPLLTDCLPEELLICQEYYRAKVRHLRLMYKSCQKVTRLIDKALKGSLGIFGIFSIAQLRRILVQIDQLNLRINREEQRRKAIIDGIVKVAKKFLPTQQVPGLTPTSLLRAAFERMRGDDQRLVRMRYRLQKKNAELAWKERWLAFQKRRLQRYRPFYAPPLLESVFGRSRY